MRPVKRIYQTLLQRHFLKNRQMVFLAGPRQVGKTTCALAMQKDFPDGFYYLNWDVKEHRSLIIRGPTSVAQFVGLEKIKKGVMVIVFDEIHKYKKWKQFLKGFFDLYSQQTKIIVTGSAKLDIYKMGNDSLMGRYFLYRVHPLSVAEIVTPELSKTVLRPPAFISSTRFQRLLEFGGFPEVLIKHDRHFSTRWQQLKQTQLIREDIRALSQIQELAQLEMLADLLRAQTGQLINYTNLANTIDTSVPTVQRWIKSLEAFYYCFSIRPWAVNVKRSLRKGPKIYLWDWSVITDVGARCENFVAAHLLKAVHFWTDRGFGHYELFFVRDKNKQEVDFLVTKDRMPWFLVEVKSSENQRLSKSLYYFQEVTGARHAFQAVFDLPNITVDCFSYQEPVIVPVQTLLSQLI